MRRVSVFDVVALAVLAIIVHLTLIPAVARVQRSNSEAKCQSNMQRWAGALSLYAADNRGRFPSNRFRTGSGWGSVNYYTALSPPFNDPATGKPWRFRYSINWVEALYDYIWDSAEKTGQDWKSFRRCPRASTTTWPNPHPVTGYPYPAVTYVLNLNLIEYWPSYLRNPRKVMMLREFWQTTISEARPANNSTSNSAVRPQYPFLNGDMRMIDGSPSVACKLHGEGSYIAFADGHVHFFTIDYYPKYADITAANCWDSETQQWWNFAPGSGKGPPYLKSIAITP